MKSYIGVGVIIVSIALEFIMPWPLHRTGLLFIAATLGVILWRRSK